jgi:hypothetical protein
MTVTPLLIVVGFLGLVAVAAAQSVEPPLGHVETSSIQIDAAGQVQFSSAPAAVPLRR